MRQRRLKRLDEHLINQQLLEAIGAEEGLPEASPIHALAEAIRTHTVVEEEDAGGGSSWPELVTIHGILADAGDEKKSDEEGRIVVAQLEALGTKASDEAKVVIQEMLDDCHTCLDSAVGFDPILQTMLVDKLGMLEQHLAETKESTDAPKAGDEAAPVPGEGAKQQGKPAASAAARTIRVNEDALDRFMSCVGELITAAESFSLAERRLRDANTDGSILRDLGAAIRSFEELSDELQETVLGLRRVPLRGALQKIPRLAREIGAQLGNAPSNRASLRRVLRRERFV